MANTVSTDLTVKAAALESLAADLGTAKLLHTWPSTTAWHYANGTDASQCDLVWTDQRTVTGAAEALDLAGSLTSLINGQAVTFAEICFIGVNMVTQTSGYTLTIGGGSTPLALFADPTHKILIGPGGPFIWSNFVNGVTIGAGSTDLLKIDPGANTITYDIILIGRSA